VVCKYWENEKQITPFYGIYTVVYVTIQLLQLDRYVNIDPLNGLCPFLGHFPSFVFVLTSSATVFRNGRSFVLYVICHRRHYFALFTTELRDHTANGDALPPSDNRSLLQNPTPYAISTLTLLVNENQPNRD
jgi:hypothetical protein